MVYTVTATARSNGCGIRKMPLLTAMHVGNACWADSLQANLQLVVNIAKEYTEQLGSDKIIAMLEGYNSYPGLYLYLGSRIAFRCGDLPTVMSVLYISRPIVALSCSTNIMCSGAEP